MITLEAFSRDRRQAVAQALDLRNLVVHEKQWLKQAQPGTLARYETKTDGMHNISRTIRRHGEMTAHIVRRDRVAIGLATVIFNQTIVHPTEGTFEGNDLDYWLKKGTDIFTHKQVVERLVAANHDLPALATVIASHPNPALGFEKVMETVGEPALLRAAGGADKYDVARQGQLAQLYVVAPEHELTPAS